MRAIILWSWFVVLLVVFTSNLDSKAHHSLKGANVCTRTERYEKSQVVPKTKRVKEYYRTWCFSIPPVCTEYRWKTVSENVTMKANHTRVAYDCCKGYEKQHHSCVPSCPLGCFHGECIEPNTCLCDEGWRSPDCSMECEPKRYGRGCKSNCTCVNGGWCDSRDGSCTCADGYIGIHCELPCPENTYGEDCKEKCECQNGAMCDIIDGSCDCEPGFYGDLCEKPCEPGTHGEDCLFDCFCFPDATSICVPADGRCICKPGYIGEYCQYQCNNFTYGDDCAGKCICENAKFCSHVNGSCVCKPGWAGIHCSIPCVPGRFGEECAFKCAKCPNETITCNHVTGHCDCPPGSYGTLCEESCLEGYWGVNCSYSCSCSGNSSCNKVTGECFCPPGWMLPNCSSPCNSEWYGNNCFFKCKCSKEELCDSVTGKCMNLVNSLTGEQKSSSHGMLEMIIVLSSIFIFTAILSYMLWRYKQRVIQTIGVHFERNAKTGSSSDNIVGDHFSNPLYGSPGNLPWTDPVASPVDGATSTITDVPLKTENASAIDLDLKSPDNVYENVLDENDKKRWILNQLISRWFARNCKKTVNISDGTTPDAAPAFVIENEYKPEELGDFKIPEEETYENALSVCRNIENTYNEVLSKE